MTGANSCSSCGSPIATTDRFCGGCGAPLDGAGRAAGAATPEAPRKVPAKTMLGMVSPFMSPSSEQPPPPAAATPSAAAPPTTKSAPKRTMLGMAPVALDAAAPVVKAEPSAPGRLLTPESTKPSAPERAKPANVGSRTMLGVAPAGAQVPSAKPAVSAQSKHTMLGAAPPGGLLAGAAAPAPAAPPYVESESRARSFTPTPDEPQPVPEAFASAERGKSRGLVLGAIAALIALALLGIAALLASRGPALSVRVVRTDTGDALEIEVPDAAPGAKVRFAGAEHPLTAGRAEFPLSADALKLGENALTIGVVSPSGSVDTAEVKLAVDYRVRTDLSTLSADPPAVQIVVDALPGSKVSVDGESLALDAQGHAAKPYPIPPQTGARFELSATYRIELSSGEPVEGAVALSLPVTSMQIDRPGTDVVTDQSIVELAGAVESGAQVLVEGRPIELNDGRFLHRAELPQPGDYVLHVTARAPNKVPAAAELRLRRVKDMTLAAASFKADPKITYAKLLQNPATYRGQKVSFDGRVYNVEVQGGRSVLQLLVLNCPSSTRCPLWVEYPQATEATVDSWVRVLGTAAGEQQFRSKQGAVQSVPSVQAQYVLKLAR